MGNWKYPSTGINVKTVCMGKGLVCPQISVETKELIAVKDLRIQFVFVM